MALPNPGMDAVPFTPLTAEFLDDIIANVEAVSAGSGLADAAIVSVKAAVGFSVQTVSTNYNAVATGTGIIPADDTIPQNTEGDQYMSQAITPKSATNRLLIEATISCSHTQSLGDISGALFQDSTANAIAACIQTNPGSIYMQNMKLTHDMVAGTTGSTTFKVRLGGSSAGTLTFNGQSSGRLRGGITLSNIKITEYRA